LWEWRKALRFSALRFTGFLPLAFTVVEARMFFFHKKNQKTFAS